MALELDAPLVQGQTYTVCWYQARLGCGVNNLNIFLNLGVSTTPGNLGTFVGRGPKLVMRGTWECVCVTFAAPNDGRYISLDPAPIAEIYLDNFTIIPGAPPVASGGALSGGSAPCGPNPELTNAAGLGAYQWQADPGCTGAFVDIPGAVNLVLAEGEYGAITQPTCFRVRRTIDDDCNPSEAYSDTLEIAPGPPPAGGSVSADDTVCVGAANLPLTLTGHVGAVVRWEVSKDLGASWQSLGKAGLTTLRTGYITVSTWFRAVVQAPGCAEAFAQPVKITVDEGFRTGTLLGGAEICGDNYSPQLRLIDHQGMITHWEVYDENGGAAGWTTIANTTDTYTPGVITATRRYRVHLTGGCGDGYSPEAVVTLSAMSAGGFAFGGGPTPVGQAPPMMILVGQVGQVLRWEVSKDLGHTWKSIGKANLTALRSGPITVTTWFRAVVRSGPCPAAVSTVVKCEAY